MANPVAAGPRAPNSGSASLLGPGLPSNSSAIRPVPHDLTEQIVEAAGKPAAIGKGDAQITRHRLRDLAEAQRVLREGTPQQLADAAAAPGLGLHFRKIIPDGCG